jgi:hypothetical protein
MRNINLIEEKYTKEEIIINIIWANIFGIIVLIIALVIFGIPFILFWHENIFTINTNISMDIYDKLLLLLKNIGFMFLIILPGIVLHELIHGIFFAIFSENKFKSVKFGIMSAKKLFSPYCHCKELLNIKHYQIAIIMPLIILGIIPAIVSIFNGNILLFFWGIIFITAGSGDILIFIKTLREIKDSIILDHQSEAGYYVFKLNEK